MPAPIASLVPGTLPLLVGGPLRTLLLPLALSTAGEATEALPFGLEMADLQRWTLIYLGLSSLAFVAVWVVGFLRR